VGRDQDGRARRAAGTFVVGATGAAAAATCSAGSSLVGTAGSGTSTRAGSSLVVGAAGTRCAVVAAPGRDRRPSSAAVRSSARAGSARAAAIHSPADSRRGAARRTGSAALDAALGVGTAGCINTCACSGSAAGHRTCGSDRGDHRA
jgi:hypothetical protein